MNGTDSDRCNFEWKNEENDDDNNIHNNENDDDGEDDSVGFRIYLSVYE